MYKKISNWLYHRSLKNKVKKAANVLNKGGVCLLPSQSVYTIVMDGSKINTVEKVRIAKNRLPHQREGLILPPEKILKLVDFEFLNQINHQINSETLIKLYETHPVALILPCKEGEVPMHLITYQDINGQRVPTILSVWNPNYKLWHDMAEELNKYPGVILVGSSANKSNQPPLKYKEAKKEFSKLLDTAIEDRQLDNFPYPGSYTILNLTTSKPYVARKGNIHPEKHPTEFELFKKILPDLVVPSD